MPTKFSLFRLSLAEVRGPDLIDLIRGLVGVSREEYLRHVFSSEWSFVHAGADYHYIPAGQAGDGTLLGRVGRQVSLSVNLSPAEQLVETQQTAWKAALIVLDPTDHADGQKCAFEQVPSVGPPARVLKSLVAYINRPSAFPFLPNMYRVQPEQIFDAHSFWSFAEENRGSITTISFHFVAPNGLFTANQSVREELAEFRNRSNASKVATTLTNPDGLNTDSEQIRDGFKYAERGSGSVRARARGGKKFSSTDRPSTSTVDLDDGDAAEEPVLRTALRHVKKILGRD